jgi:DNA polymerase-3 subunit gamma/tau
MAYQVLARKYRPQRFSDVAGQEHVTRTLLNALEQGRTAHGYIFSGHRGIGKTTIARILAMALNCRTPIGSAERPSAEPCAVCVSCQEIRAGNSVDMLEIDAATNRGIDEIRELRDAARYSPARDRYKIYLLDEAHQITDAAFNALLKTLEEPPEHVVFMMATTQPEDIPQTIRSRCQHFSFHAVAFDEILAELRQIGDREKIVAGDDALSLLAEAGDGSMRDALSILDQAIASAPLVDGVATLEAGQIRELMGTVPNPVFEQLLLSVHAQESAAVMQQINRLLDAGNTPAQLARQLVRYLRNSLMAKLGGETTELLQISADERARAARTAALFSEEDLTRFLQVMLRTFDDLNYRQEQRFHLELGLIKLVHLERLIPIEKLLGSLPESSGSGGAGRPGSMGSSTGVSGAAGSSGASARTPAVRTETITAPTAVAARPVAPPASHAPAPAGEPEAPAPQAVEGSEPAERSDLLVSQEQPVLQAQPELQAQPAEARSEASPGTPAGPKVELQARNEAPDDLASIRDAVVAALDDAGHGTAAAKLSTANWSREDGGIRVEIGITKKMLGLAMNAEATKIVREALAAAGVAPKITMISAETVTASSAVPLRPGGASDRGIQAIALKNPLVRQAQELFHAEVRNVLDLRESPRGNH